MTLLLPYAKMFAPMLDTGNYGNTGLYGVCDWNEFGTFHYVSGFAGYLVLAYYLVKFPPAWDWRKTGRLHPDLPRGLPRHGLRIRRPAKPLPGQLRLPRDRLVFRRHQRLYDDLPGLRDRAQALAFKPRAWLSRLAGATFGIYLCHFILVQAGYDLVQRIPALPTLLRILLIACLAFAAVSWAVVRLMQRWRRDAPAGGGVMRYQHSALSFNSGIRSFVKPDFLMPCRFWAV